MSSRFATQDATVIRKPRGAAGLRRIGRLPPRALAACAALLAAAVVPPAVAIPLAMADGPTGSLSRLLTTSEAAAACVAMAAVLAFAPPRSASPLAYARQLRARFLELQSTFDADDRRRPGEGKEKEDDRVPSEP